MNIAVKFVLQMLPNGKKGLLKVKQYTVLLYTWNLNEVYKIILP